jgi:hypothetical protein
MVAIVANNHPVLHNIARSYITGINVIERPTNEHITAPIKSTTAKYGMQNCPSFMGFILYPYTNITTLELKGIGHHQGMKMYHLTNHER